MKIIKSFSAGMLGILLLTTGVGVNAGNNEIIAAGEPKIMITSYDIAEGSPAAGKEFTMRFNIKNTNLYAGAYNVMMTVMMQTNNVRIADRQTNQIYMEQIEPGEVVFREMDFEITDIYESDIMIMEVAFSYMDENRIEWGNTSILTPSIVKDCELEINSLSVAETAVVGARSLVNVRYSSTGELPVSRAVMIIEGDIADSPKEVELEQTENEQKYLDYYVNFLDSGKQKLSIRFIYEDEDGNKYEIDEKVYQVQVGAYPAATAMQVNPGRTLPVNTRARMLGMAAAVTAVAVVGMAIFLWRKQKKNKKRGKGRNGF